MPLPRLRAPALLAAALAAPLAFAAPASAQQLIESYTARLSRADHFNSYGERLSSPAAIIRQDRANFHKFGVRDSEDEGDRYFSDMANRALMERLLERGRTTGAARRAIVNGTPLIRVDVYDGPRGPFIEVSVD
ncbi:MAG: hypothetical protein LWW93_15615 [Hyphomicrobiales bacterium]|nr:hypothetical protein [Hyphomicrobiales bacterium]